MKTLILNILVILLFASCADNNQVTAEDCRKEGLVFKEGKMLNYRTGEYEHKTVCLKRG